jgi:methylated-DNA-[protein]-cysteine S-methyltransferase
MQKSHVFKYLDSPVGRLRLWENDDPHRVPLGEQKQDDQHPILRETEQQLSEYFRGKRKSFSIKLDFSGSDFQKKVWAALLTIPCGETRSYGEIARQVGNPKASRAVGAANGKNPISIIAPCHRVIGSSGKLTGFAGGLENKALLLGLEQRMMGKTSVRQMQLI